MQTGRLSVEFSFDATPVEKSLVLGQSGHPIYIVRTGEMAPWTHVEALLEVGTAGQHGHATRRLRNHGASCALMLMVSALHSRDMRSRGSLWHVMVQHSPFVSCASC